MLWNIIYLILLIYFIYYTEVIVCEQQQYRRISGLKCDIEVTQVAQTFLGNVLISMRVCDCSSLPWRFCLLGCLRLRWWNAVSNDDTVSLNVWDVIFMSRLRAGDLSQSAEQHSRVHSIRLSPGMSWGTWLRWASLRLDMMKVMMKTQLAGAWDLITGLITAASHSLESSVGFLALRSEIKFFYMRIWKHLTKKCLQSQ